MKIMLVIALIGALAAVNGGDNEVETQSYDSTGYVDCYEDCYYEEDYYEDSYETYYYEPSVDYSAWSDTHQTAPMPETPYSNEELLGYWMDYSDAEQPDVMYFYEENGQLMYRYYSIVAGNSIGINIANEVTEWEYCTGIVNSMPNQGNVYCQCGTGENVYVSFYYGFDGTDVMYHQEDGTAFYKVQ